MLRLCFRAHLLDQAALNIKIFIGRFEFAAQMQVAHVADMDLSQNCHCESKLALSQNLVLQFDDLVLLWVLEYFQQIPASLVAPPSPVVIQEKLIAIVIQSHVGLNTGKHFEQCRVHFPFVDAPLIGNIAQLRPVEHRKGHHFLHIHAKDR